MTDNLQACKGVLLCGGEGTRLRPLTLAVNKHLIRVGKKPMVEYPLARMIEAGIKDIHVVTGGENYPGVVKYLGSGAKWGVRITYSIQDKAGGIAEALGMAEAFVGGDICLVILGDNVFDMNLQESVTRFVSMSAPVRRGMFFGYVSDYPERYGVVKFDGDKRPVDVIEKPSVPPSKTILAGIYLYTPDVFDLIQGLKPSTRGELEVTDLNRHYIKAGLGEVVAMTGEWTDCGSFDTLARAEAMVKCVSGKR